MLAFSSHTFIITVCLCSIFKTCLSLLTSACVKKKKSHKLLLPKGFVNIETIFFSLFYSGHLVLLLGSQMGEIIINNWFICVDKMIWCHFLSLTDWSGWNCIPLIKLWWNVIRWMSKVTSQEKLLWLTWCFLIRQSFLGIWSHHCVCSHHIDFVVCY